MRQKVTVQPRLKRGEFFAAFPTKFRLVRQKRRHSVPCSNLQKTENRVKLIYIIPVEPGDSRQLQGVLKTPQRELWQYPLPHLRLSRRHRDLFVS